MRVLASALVLLGLCCSAQSQKQPHIIFILVDDLGWDDVGFHGSPQIPTPNLDFLANQGVILNNYYVSPVCTPTRASLMTGKYPIHLGLQHFVIFAAQPSGLPLSEITLPQYLKILGYRTAGIGKWHLGFFTKEYTPTHRGFDSFYGMWSAKADYWNHSSYENNFWGLDMRNNMEKVTSDNGVYGTEVFAREAIKVIDHHDPKQPLFLYLAHQAPHSANQNKPLEAPQELIDKFANTIEKPERREYAAMVASIDESMGDIYRTLQKRNMLNDTVIIFSTDNGGAPNGFNWNQGCNYPLRGGKDMVWEGGVRGTAFVYSQLIKQPGRVSMDLIDVTDWVPTLYYLAGGTPSHLEPNMDGKNVWQTISDKKPSPRKEVLHNIDPWRNFSAIRMDQYKLVVGQDDTYYKAKWTGRYKGKQYHDSELPRTLPGAIVTCGMRDKSLKCNTSHGAVCLFDIEKDPCEFNDISSKYPDIVARLQKRLHEFNQTMLNVWYPTIDNASNPSKFDGFWSPWRQLCDDAPILNAQDDLRKLENLEGNPNLVQKGYLRPDMDSVEVFSDGVDEYQADEQDRENVNLWLPHKVVRPTEKSVPPANGFKYKYYYDIT